MPALPGPSSLWTAPLSLWTAPLSLWAAPSSFSPLSLWIDPFSLWTVPSSLWTAPSSLWIAPLSLWTVSLSASRLVLESIVASLILFIFFIRATTFDVRFCLFLNLLATPKREKIGNSKEKQTLKDSNIS